MIDLPAGTRLVLASASPRRADLLRSVGLDFEVRPADIDETPRAGEDAIEYVCRLSIEKARAIACDVASHDAGEIILAADTTVELGGRILGKPADDREAADMLRSLSGRTHRVHSGVTVVRGSLTNTISSTTAVTFAATTDEMIARYVATREPRDKAGGYAIQGLGAALVIRVEGSLTNVIGLPLAETIALLAAHVHDARRN